MSNTSELSKPKPDLTIKKTGAVYTPASVAFALCELAAARVRDRSGLVLEPSVGEGAFLKGLNDHDFQNVVCVDQDDNALERVKPLHPKYQFVASEFLAFSRQDSQQKFDLIIGNPPYVRRHNFGPSFKHEIEHLSKDASVPKSTLRNAWAAFVVKSAQMLNKGGVLAFVLPYELINVKYGLAVQQFLQVKFKRVDIYIPQAKAFKNIDQDAVVLLASGRSDGKVDHCDRFVHEVPSLDDLKPIRSAPIAGKNSSDISLDIAALLFDSDTRSLLAKLRDNLNRIGDFCDTRAGIVTAANSYFILNEQQVSEFGLSDHQRPILSRSAYLPQGPIFGESHLKELLRSKSSLLIDFGTETVDSLPERAKKYIALGEQLGLDDRYKMRHRSPWYRVPVVPVGDGFFFKRSHILPRFCINEAKILVTDTAYVIKMKDGRSIRSLCYSYYNSLSLLFSEIDGRFYGGGVLELTPNEFRNVPVVFADPDASEFKQFISRFPRNSASNEVLFEQNDQYLRQRLQLTSDQLTSIQSALVALRSHRLRHGSA